MTKLRNMLPILTTNNLANGVLCDAKQLPDHRKSYQTWLIHFSNLDNLLFGQLCGSLSRASNGIKSALVSTVGHVFFVRSNKQMRGIATSSVVAFMARLQSARYFFSKRVLPSQPVSHASSRLLLPVLNNSGMWRKSSVTMVRFFRNPKPALIRLSFLHMPPKSYNGWGFSYHTCGEFATG